MFTMKEEKLIINNLYAAETGNKDEHYLIDDYYYEMREVDLLIDDYHDEESKRDIKHPDTDYDDNDRAYDLGKGN